MNTSVRRSWILTLAALFPPGMVCAQQANIADFAIASNVVTLAWEGTWPPYLVQTSSNLLDWCDQGDLLNGTATGALAAARAEACYRVRHLNPTNELGDFYGLVQTEQGEGGEPLGRHRLKSRWWLFKPQGTLSNSPAAFFRQLIVFYQHAEGAGVATFAGRLDALGAVATPGDADLLTVAWTNGAGQDRRSCLLTLDFPYKVNAVRAQAPLPSDPFYHLQCVYDVPQPELDPYEWRMVTTATDQVYLAELAPADTNSYMTPMQSYAVVAGGMKVAHAYWDGLPLWEGSPPMVFKTYILDRWTAPSWVSGGGLPAFGTDSYFARTMLPGHHNFFESVLIEPARDPAINESVREALRAANVQYIHTQHYFYEGMGTDEIRFIGFDGAIHAP